MSIPNNKAFGFSDGLLYAARKKRGRGFFIFIRTTYKSGIIPLLCQVYHIFHGKARVYHESLQFRNVYIRQFTFVRDFLRLYRYEKTRSGLYSDFRILK